MLLSEKHLRQNVLKIYRITRFMKTILLLIATLASASSALFAAQTTPATAESSVVGNLKAHKDFKLNTAS